VDVMDARLVGGSESEEHGNINRKRGWLERAQLRGWGLADWNYMGL
jgi:hypothetical protein